MHNQLNEAAIAITLGNKKDEAIKEIASKMTSEICKLAEIEYMRGSLEFDFKKNMFTKNQSLQMEYPGVCKEPGGFTKILAKLHIIEPFENNNDEVDDLYRNIVDLFNGVQDYEGNEKERVLNILARNLQLKGFSFVHREEGIKILWWGE